MTNKKGRFYKKLWDSGYFIYFIFLTIFSIKDLKNPSLLHFYPFVIASIYVTWTCKGYRKTHRGTGVWLICTFVFKVHKQKSHCTATFNEWYIFTKTMGVLSWSHEKWKQSWHLQQIMRVGRSVYHWQSPPNISCPGWSKYLIKSNSQQIQGMESGTGYRSFFLLV